MAADYIVVDRSKQLGNQVVRLANLIREVREICDGLSDVANHSFDGGDFTVLETNFGFAVGAGANFATLLAYVQEIMNTNTDVTGANRLARLDEFVARLAGQ